MYIRVLIMTGDHSALSVSLWLYYQHTVYIEKPTAQNSNSTVQVIRGTRQNEQA